MDALLGTLKSLPEVAGRPLAIIAYIVVIGAWLLSYMRTARLKIVMDKITSLPEADRKIVLGTEMNTVIPASISAEEWLQGKRQQYLMIGYVLTLLAIVFLLGLAYVNRGVLSIDDVKVKTGWLGLIGTAWAQSADTGVDVFQPRGDSTKHRFAFDLILRNSSDKPVTVTDMTVAFDPDEGGFLSGVLDVSNTYMVLLAADGLGTVSSRAGDGTARAWYPNPDGQVLLVRTPLQQVLAPLSTDRFVVDIRFPSDYALKGPMRKAKLSLTWNGKQTTETTVSLAPAP